ncbi:signal peptidase II [Lactonifactor longoviformis]|uniref:signal peptidase II n=1 Tax=Lactonifactor longoviformis TaxID=341220 RepID=UPI0036F24812
MGFLIIAAGVFCLDFFIKRKVEADKILNVTEEHLGGRVLIRRTNNPGIAFGLFKKDRKKVTFIQLTGLLLAGAGYLWLLFQKGYTLAKVGASFILGGGLSNWHDRQRQGYVTDYVSFKCPWKKFENIVFNVSDLFIFLGCIVTVVSQTVHKK